MKAQNMTRKLSFEDAKAIYTKRFTMEHVPSWAGINPGNGLYYAPQYSSDREWYSRTFFEGESKLATERHCYSTYPTWPLGQWLHQPFTK
jgi:hypothetical protein